MFDKLFKDHKQKQLALFAVKALGLYIVWFISYDFFFERDGSVNTWLNHRVAADAAVILNMTGFDADTSPGNHQSIILIDQVGIVGVGNPCNGLELFALFAGFVIAFPGALKNKLWFIPTGILLIHLINVIRTYCLALIQLKAPHLLDFNHHYTFTVIVYAFIFGLWILWTNRYSGLEEGNNTGNSPS